MKENTRFNVSFWFSIFAIAISIVTIALFFWRVTPHSVVDNLTFISVIAAFIGISVTLVIGYQIYNAVDLRQKVKEVERLKNSLEQQKRQLKELEIEQAEGFEIIQARLYSKTSGMELEALLHLHSSIKYSLSVDHKQDGYKWLLDELEQYMLNITLSSFYRCTSKSDYTKQANKVKELCKNNDYQIRNHPNFLFVKDRYEELMKKFDIRLDYISNQKNVSLTEIDGLLN